ncbi:hypothetical protein [Brazilian marseillevirus]|uniref:hypothetical protein n=1 Tax=Brazilian marseillevirus TaxID=1813599 RepID=UPI0007821175|nr:hypothetical protein A3303_gp050 [Brazilian marseillevirus]AMQ10558.1 hypothetical protein [Brazilian marseillevirus]
MSLVEVLERTFRAYSDGPFGNDDEEEFQKVWSGLCYALDIVKGTDSRKSKKAYEKAHGEYVPKISRICKKRREGYIVIEGEVYAAGEGDEAKERMEEYEDMRPSRKKMLFSVLEKIPCSSTPFFWGQKDENTFWFTYDKNCYGDGAPRRYFTATFGKRYEFLLVEGYMPMGKEDGNSCSLRECISSI